MNYDTSNEMFRLTVELVNQSERNIFLTGKAGTGKTTFLKFIRENCLKQMAVVAPTGVAAINAGGVTMHSFFQLPISPFIPESSGFREKKEQVTSRSSLLSRLRMTNEKKKVLQELELLIIDEISMVRCDMLDAVDTVLRHIRRRQQEKFGGVQVLFIGDMFQLPPVIKEQDWTLLKEYYNSPYFFDSLVIKEDQPIYIEFNKIYRQSEENFIHLLNQVRNNEMDEYGAELLESRYQPAFRRTSQDGYIILTTHNDKARDINNVELNNLDNRLFTYKADVKDDFPENAFPAEENLQLKVGAQVMFIKNDTEKNKRYINGKIAVVKELEKEKIIVQCNDEPDTIEVKREKWENIRYSINKTNRQMEEEVLGSFEQYPLRLAWAITIHKSQGLTFEKAIIDAGSAFAPGQAYVALSRCTTLEGIILKSKVRSNGQFTDQRIVEFSQNRSSSALLTEELKKSRKNYRLKILLSIFDYSKEVGEIKEIQKLLEEHKTSFNPESIEWAHGLLIKTNALQTTSAKFQIQINNLFQLEDPVQLNHQIQKRIKAGALYFLGEQNKIIEMLKKSPALTDSRTYAKEFNEAVRELFSAFDKRGYLLSGLENNFEIESYHLRKKKFVLSFFNVNAYAGVAKQKIESPHPELYRQLRGLRDTICSKKDLPIYIVAGSNTLNEMARYLPQTLKELRKISGFGDAKIEQYGQQFLDKILIYSKENDLSSLIHEKAPKRERKTTGEKKLKTDTKAESFRLYKEGKMFEEIAKERKLTIQTIESHLAHYVKSGEININELMNKEKIDLIASEVKNTGNNLMQLKEKLKSNISFGDIKLVLAWLEFKKNSPSHINH